MRQMIRMQVPCLAIAKRMKTNRHNHAPGCVVRVRDTSFRPPRNNSQAGSVTTPIPFEKVQQHNAQLASSISTDSVLVGGIIRHTCTASEEEYVVGKVSHNCFTGVDMAYWSFHVSYFHVMCIIGSHVWYSFHVCSCDRKIFHNVTFGSTTMEIVRSLSQEMQRG